MCSQLLLIIIIMKCSLMDCWKTASWSDLPDFCPFVQPNQNSNIWIIFGLLLFFPNVCGFVLLVSSYSYLIIHITPYWGFPHLIYRKLRSNLGNRLRYAKLFLFNCSSCQLRISLKLRNPASKVRGWYDSIKMQFNMLYLILRLENPIWWDRHTHTHIPKWPCFSWLC